MVEPVHPSHVKLVHPTVDYERSDVNFRAIAIIVAVVLAIGIVVHAVVTKFFFDYRAHEEQVKRSPYPLAPGPSTDLPREPRLEQVERMAGSEAANVYEREKANLARLQAYGHTADDAYVQVPIDRAMQFLVDKNVLKSRSEPPPEQRRRAGGLLDAGQPNAGRMFKEDAK
jgi:hypothetical protein